MTSSGKPRYSIFLKGKQVQVTMETWPTFGDAQQAVTLEAFDSGFIVDDLEVREVKPIAVSTSRPESGGGE